MQLVDFVRKISVLAKQIQNNKKYQFPCYEKDDIGNRLCPPRDNSRLGYLQPVPVQDRDLSEGGGGLHVLPLGEDHAVVLILDL